MMKIASLLISFFALLVSGVALWETRNNNRIVMRPVINGHEIMRTNSYGYEITNKGLGPAYFKSVEWYYDAISLGDKPFIDAVDEIIAEYGLPLHRSLTIPAQNAVMRPGESMVLGELMITHENIPALTEIKKKGFGVRIVYESVYGDRYVFVSDERIELGKV